MTPRPGQRTVIIALILTAELGVALAGLIIFLADAGQHPLGILLVKLGAGAAFFTSLWLQYRRRRQA